LEGLDEDVAADVSALQQILPGLAWIEQPRTGSQLWADWIYQAWQAGPPLARLGVPISALTDLIARTGNQLGPAWLADVGCGQLYAAPSDARTCRAQAESLAGFLSWVDAPGQVGETRRQGVADRMDQLKTLLDPGGILPPFTR